MESRDAKGRGSATDESHLEDLARRRAAQCTPDCHCFEVGLRCLVDCRWHHDDLQQIRRLEEEAGYSWVKPLA